MDRLTQEEIAEFREIFNLVDKDGGGTISAQEVAEILGFHA
jgi:Ca2+-binding EF-hand superfamily protein